jgi:hypothetical protein
MDTLPSKRKSAEELQALGKEHAERQMYNERLKGAAPKAHPALIIFGYVFAVWGGILGLIIACFVISKPASKHHGALILIISVFFFVVWGILKRA